MYDMIRLFLRISLQILLNNVHIRLGNQYMEDSQLKPLENGYQKQYDGTVNPSMANVFATAAFRFGHSLVQGQME